MAIALETLPDEVLDVIKPYLVSDSPTLASLSVLIAEKRDHAKQARQEDGVEDVWTECEEAYCGVDDSNRNEHRAARWSKPMSSDGPVQTNASKPQNQEVRSTVFVKLTARYVDAGAAMVQEILLPADDKAFSFSETPVPELIKAKEDASQVFHDGMGTQQPVPLFRNLRQGEQPPPAQPAPPAGQPAPAPMMASAMPTALAGAVPPPPPPAAAPTPGAAPAAPGVPPPGQVPLTVKDLAEETIEIARKKAKKAEDRIYGWMVKSRYAGEMRKVIFDASKLGVGVLKGPFPKPKRTVAILKDATGKQAGVEIQIKEQLQPSYEWRDPWNIFPDPACGENIHDGDYIFERDYLSPRQVRALKKQDGYIGKQIDAVLAIGPPEFNLNSNGEGQGAEEDGKKKQKGRYEVWYYYGSLKRDEFACICEELGNILTEDDVPKTQQQVFATVTLIGDIIVKGVLNPLDSGTFPYYSVPWQRRTGSWAGMGVAEQVRAPQRILNASVRAMLDNAGKSAGNQYIISQKMIRPANQSWTITRDKIWYQMGDMADADVRKSFAAIQIPNVTEQLMTIINEAKQLAEESSSIPLVVQGRDGPDAPDTLGGQTLQNNNANRVLRMVGYAFDDYITEPVVLASYEYLLMDPDVPDDEKGDFEIDAHGSVALVERAIQDQTIAQMGPMTLNPAYGWNPKKWAKVFAKTKHIKSDDLEYTEEEQARMDANPVKPPAVEVATINQDTALKLGVMKQTTEQQSQQSEQAIEQAAQTLEGHRTQVDATVRLHEIETRRQLEMLRYANDHQMNLDDVKSKLADRAMTLNTQERLNAQDNAVDLHKHHNPGTGASAREEMRDRPSGQTPPVTVPGKKAGNGRQFEQAR
jgi:hypothetical protein